MFPTDFPRARAGARGIRTKLVPDAVDVPAVRMLFRISELTSVEVRGTLRLAKINNERRLGGLSQHPHRLHRSLQQKLLISTAFFGRFLSL